MNTEEIVKLQGVIASAIKLVAAINLLKMGKKGVEEVVSLCDAIINHYGPVDVIPLVETLAEEADGKMLVMAAMLAKTSLLPAKTRQRERTEAEILAELVTGIAQVVAFDSTIPERAEVTREYYKIAACKGIDSELAKLFILQWLKDWLDDGAAVDEETRREILADKYVRVWQIAKDWLLSKFGYDEPAIKPQKINPCDTSYQAIMSERSPDNNGN